MKNQEVIEAHFAEVGKYNPEFIAIGLGGFDDYVVFGFPAKGNDARYGDIRTQSTMECGVGPEDVPALRGASTAGGGLGMRSAS
ncbi:hypothetical protein [Burkholderia arboris]|uniref:hypothetical protein n=1 Tax=Burkholderia arboris TaxID=488730 RepID=UPI001CF314F7|nr:hypothetical protein [Burkholderia arboris]MCA8494020.1 hypothetical protein [Burkholderia arboris]